MFVYVFVKQYQDMYTASVHFLLVYFMLCLRSYNIMFRWMMCLKLGKYSHLNFVNGYAVYIIAFTTKIKYM